MDNTKLPRWKSHKEVWADQIARVKDGGKTWVLNCTEKVDVQSALSARVPAGTDPTGGYYVRYEDGFESWSPAKAFEEGYTRI